MSGPLRIGLASQTSFIQSELARMKAKISETEQMATSGLRLLDPSDDPGALPEIDGLQNAILDQTVWQDNASFAISLQDTADTALGEARSLMTRAQEIAVLGASETGAATERTQLADEVAALRDSLVSLGNTRFGDRYLFGGQNFATPPFAADGTYQGGTGTAGTRVGEVDWGETGWDGSTIFRGGDDPIAALNALEAALRADDADAVGVTLDLIDPSIDQLIEVRAAIGAETVRTEEAQDVSANLESALRTRLQDQVNIDEIEVYTNLATLRTAYEGALSVTGSTVRTSLFDYIQ